jgi:chromosome partitioning protein
MTKVISFISRKGGTGKTTNAIHLATMLRNLGHSVVLVETDTNYTLNTLRKMEIFKSGATTDNLFEIVGSEDHTVTDELELVKKNRNPDYIVVDSAGKTTDEGIKRLCVASDAVVVPTSLTQNDLLVTYQTIQDLAPARSIKPALKILVLPNRIHASTRHKTVLEMLGDLDAIVLDRAVPQKNLFVNFSTILPEKEYQDIAKSILAHLQ